MKKKITSISIILIIAQMIYSQGYVLGVRNTSFEGFTIISTQGKILFELELHADPILSNVIIGENSYPNSIIIPINDNKFPIRYGGKFYIINTKGEVVNKLHPNTEWIHNWQSKYPRVSLKHYPAEGLFKDMFINLNGDQLFSNEIFDDADDFLGELAPIRRKESENWVLINEKGNNEVDIQSMLEEDSETLYNAFYDIWSYRKKSTYEERFITKSGFNSDKLSLAISNYHDLDISESLLKSDAIKIGEFLLNSTKNHLLITSRDKERNIIQALYDRNLNRIELAKPNENGRYFHLRSNQDYVFGTFEFADGKKESIVINSSINEVIYRTKDRIMTVVNGNVLIASDSSYRLVDLQNKQLFESKEDKHFEVTEDYRSVQIPEHVEVLIIRNLKDDELPINILKQSKNIKTIALIECRELNGTKLNGEYFPNMINLHIVRCNKLKNFNPWEKELINLKTYSNGLNTEFQNEIELTVSNNR